MAREKTGEEEIGGKAGKIMREHCSSTENKHRILSIIYEERRYMPRIPFFNRFADALKLNEA